jgi:hypothetical protein
MPAWHSGKNSLTLLFFRKEGINFTGDHDRMAFVIGSGSGFAIVFSRRSKHGAQFIEKWALGWNYLRSRLAQVEPRRLVHLGNEPRLPASGRPLDLAKI